MNGRKSIIGALAASVALAGSPFFMSSGANAEPLSTDTPGLLTVSEAEKALEKLPIGSSDGGYNRADFTSGWKVVTANEGSDEVEPWYGWQKYVEEGSPYAQDDVTKALAPRKGCDAREITLIRDAIDGSVQWGDDCSVKSGSWYDSYTGKTINDPSQLDIEHIVALQDAWKTGASEWSPEKRESFAQNPLVLAAVDKSENRAKGSAAPKFEFEEDGSVKLDEKSNPIVAEDGWVPENRDEWSSYAQRYISIKSNYGLSLEDENVRKTLKYMLESSEKSSNSDDSLESQPEIENPPAEDNSSNESGSDQGNDSSDNPGKPSDNGGSGNGKQKPKDNPSSGDTSESESNPGEGSENPDKDNPSRDDSESAPERGSRPDLVLTGKGYKEVDGASDIEPNLLEKAYSKISPLAGNAGNIVGWSQKLEGNDLVITAHYENAEFSYNTATDKVDTFVYPGKDIENQAPSEQQEPNDSGSSNSSNENSGTPEKDDTSSNNDDGKKDPETTTTVETREVEKEDPAVDSSQTQTDSSEYNSGASVSTGGTVDEGLPTGALASLYGLIGLVSIALSRRFSRKSVDMKN